MTEEWLAPVAEALQIARGTGGVIVLLPEYRPNLAKTIATVFELPYRDFRADILIPAGWDAFQTPLRRLDDYLDETGGVVMNAEALLATKPEAERQAWLSTFPQTPRALTVLPLALYPGEAPQGERTVRLAPAAVPEESVLLRLVER